LAFSLFLIGSAERSASATPTAPTFVVNSVGDAVAAGPLTDGVCSTTPKPYPPVPTCTLRAALIKANHWPGGDATITFDPTQYGNPILLTITPTGDDDELSGDLNISHTLHLIGNGRGQTIIDAQALSDRIFWIEPGATVDISGVTLQHGAVSTNGGGGVYVDHNAALTLSQSAVLSNTDQSINGGGGLASQGTLTVTHSLVQGNSTSKDGGGLYLDNGSAFINATTIINNHATGTISGGGGLINVTPAITLTQSTISGNTAHWGGGVENEYGQMTIINSTLSGNSALQDGGGLLVVGLSSSTTLDSVTISDNTADSGQTGAGKGGGVAVETGNDPLTMQNSLLADNYGTVNIGLSWIPFRDDCFGAPISAGYNLLTFLSTPDVHTCTFTPGVGDVVTTTVNLGTLQDNGGPTWTQALQPGSAALDAANPGGCNGPAALPLTTDQRGFPRTANGAGHTRCDIGAFEVQRTAYLPFVVK